MTSSRYKFAGMKIHFEPRHIKVILLIGGAVFVLLTYGLYQQLRGRLVEEGDIPVVENMESMHRYRSTGSLKFKNRTFYLGNKSIVILSGALHYFRVIPEYWSDRILKMKACGLNTVETYVPWNLHEELPGKYNFEGMLNLREFINTAKFLQMNVILRPGPYICSEWDLGGLPGWLLRDPNMKLRTNYKGYMQAVDKYFSVLIPKVADLQYSKGGPIIAFQVENEFGSYSTESGHLLFIKEKMEQYGVVEMFFTSDGWNYKNRLGTAVAPFFDNALPTANFQSFAQGRAIFNYIKKLSPDFPLFNMEFWDGWFDHWGERNGSGASVEVVAGFLEQIFVLGASINFYMFHGGTNFGFTAGANYFESTNYQPVVTSYDYDAPLTEAGDITPKYKKIRELIFKYYPTHAGGRSMVIPGDVPKKAYGNFNVISYLPFDNLIDLSNSKQQSSKLLFMENTDFNNNQGQTFGYILYRRVINQGKQLRIEQTPRDHLQVLLNGGSAGVFDWKDPHVVVDFKEHQHVKFTEKGNVLDLLVENLGRINYVIEGSKKMDGERKGLQSDVYLDSKVLTDWTIVGLDFKPDFIARIEKSDKWQTTAVKCPAMFKVDLTVSGKPLDTFLLMEGWVKGAVFVNGFNLGRYWNIGPQKTLYIPGPRLKPGSNSILIFEEQSAGKSVKFVDNPILK